jgi:hypothetical protein
MDARTKKMRGGECEGWNRTEFKDGGINGWTAMEHL